MIYILAQSNALGNEAAQRMLENALRLNQNTAESWQRMWDLAIDPGQPLWQACMYLGGFIFYFCLIVHIIREYHKGPTFFKENALRLGFTALLFFNNGYFLVQLTKLMYSISNYWVSIVLNFTFAGVRISEAIAKIQNTAVANARTREIFAECVGKTGTTLDECIYDPVKLDRATELLQSLGNNAPLQGNLLEQIVNGVTSNLTAVITLPVLNGLQMISNVVQWCCMNLHNLALILAILFGAIHLGLSWLPNGGYSISKWVANFISLLLFPIAYVIAIGFMANVLALTEQLGQPLGSTFLDVAYLVFVAFFAPWLCWSGIKGMSTEIFESTVNSAKTTMEAGVKAASGGSDLIAKSEAFKALHG